ncbi:MAG TPA: EamA family transporter, partial [Gaiellaceae bacterium]|nr:EamA family transporter [Gaiellaceae bacterium]
MNRRHLIMLLALAGIWGASFMLIEIALRELAPSTLILLRLALGALAIAAFVPFSGARFGQLRGYALPLALMGALNSALPFFLIAWGQQHIPSGLAAIFNASA